MRPNLCFRESSSRIAGTRAMGQYLADRWVRADRVMPSLSETFTQPADVD